MDQQLLETYSSDGKKQECATGPTKQAFSKYLLTSYWTKPVKAVIAVKPNSNREEKYITSPMEDTAKSQAEDTAKAKAVPRGKGEELRTLKD